MSPIRAALFKELRLELRTPQTIPAMALFAMTTFVVFHFALQEPTVEGELAAGVLTVTLLFAAMLGINRLFVADHEDGGFDGFLLAPVDRSTLLVAKAVSLIAFLVIVELVAVPLFAVLLLEPGLDLTMIARLMLVLSLTNAGVAAIGTVVAALAIKTRARDLIVPLIALPLLMPVVIGTARCLDPTFTSTGAQALPGRWLLILGLYDLVFGLLAYAVFDYLLED
ncbi:MAG TPA: heme exporter protein CcmB [Baekduia sp.]|nr:heme exporter protein CcmB [Baekduia sp.]